MKITSEVRLKFLGKTTFFVGEVKETLLVTYLMIETQLFLISNYIFTQTWQNIYYRKSNIIFVKLVSLK